jgi:uncharacterized OsmC-like protein
MMTFQVTATRGGGHVGEASNATASVPLGTDMAGNDEALNPMELLMSALAACMIKGTNRLMPILGITVEGMTIEMTAARQDSPPLVHRIDYRIAVDSPDSDEKLALLHENLLKFGTVTNTIAAATTLAGTLERA